MICPDLEHRALSGASPKLAGCASLAVRPDRLASEGTLQAAHRLERVPGWRGVTLGPGRAVYLRDAPPKLSRVDKEALSTVARRVLAGSRAPLLSSFPPGLRRAESSEVMVMLDEDGRARLWRSARATSIAAALLTALRTASKRWSERSNSLGGPLAEVLPGLRVKVIQLREDGDVVSFEPSWINRAVGPAHGLGYDRRGDWHYLLPWQIRSDGVGGAAAALTELLEERGLGPRPLATEGARLYRFLPVTLAISEAPSGPSVEKAPEEL